MYRRTLPFLIWLCVIVTLAGCSTEKDYAALVNGEKITIAQFKQYDNNRNRGTGQIPPKQLLDDLIEVRVALQEAKKIGISVSAKEIEEQIKVAEAAVPGLMDKIKEKNDLGYYKETLKNTTILHQLMDKVIDKDKVTVTDKEIEEALKENKEADREQIIIELKEEKAVELFNQWVAEKRQKAQVEVNEKIFS